MKYTFALAQLSVFVVTALFLVTFTNGDCASETEALQGNEEILAAEIAVLTKLDISNCEKGNKEGTRLICGLDYEVETPDEYAAFQSACADAGGQFQTIDSGVHCKHPDTKVEIDHDVLNTPDCVGVSCLPGYAQSIHENNFFAGYKDSLEGDGSECKLTSGGAVAYSSSWASTIIGMVALCVVGMMY